MVKDTAYTSLANKRRIPGISFRRIFLIYLILHAAVIMSYSQDYPGEYDEILVHITVPGIGGGEINAVIKGEQLFLPITDLFDFLQIRNVPDPALENIKGFLIDSKATYIIDRIKNNILFNNKVYGLDPGALIRTEANLYLRCDYFSIFGLNCTFNFRDLSVLLKSDLEFPAIREMRQEEVRKNLSRIRGEVQADTVIGRQYPMFHFGMADWSIVATEYDKGKPDARFNLALGSIIAGGETTVSLNYNTTETFKEKYQYYLWRYANNDNKAIRQVMAGKISTNAISSIYNPVVGLQITNTPTSFRRSFGSYTLTDNTDPGWIVELYVNNVLIDYVTADASGFFTFEVPLVYGYTHIMLKFYSPWGEERTEERNISIPFNFLPKNTFEYTLSAGLVEDTLMTRFSKASFNYGLTRSITLGAGMEYLSSITSAPAMPYVNASVRLASNVLLSGEYTHNVRATGKFSVRLPSNLQLEIDYTKYAEGQKAINYNYKEERKASFSVPLHMKKLMLFNRFSVDQLILPAVNYTTGEWMISGSVFGLNTNISTFGVFIGNKRPYVYSNFSLALRLPASFIIIPQAQYGYTDGTFLTAKLKLEKMFFRKAFLNVGYERNLRNNMNLGEIGLRYDFKFAQTGVSARQSENSAAFVQYARGSIINNTRTRYLAADNRVNVGRGGISILPFLDVNGDGRWNEGEQKIDGLSIHSSMGRVEYSDRDTIIRILNLEPYTSCFIEFDQSSLENISWKIGKRTMNVAVDPNMLKLIELPVSVVGEAAGSVMIESKGEKSGLGRMTVNFYSRENRLIGRVLSEEDGYFSYLGLTPGTYTARLDTSQLKKLGMLTDTSLVGFRITAGTDGDFVDGLDFTLRIKGDTARAKTIQKEYVAIAEGGPADTSYIIVHEAVRELVTITEDGYALQLGAFLRKDYAEAYREKIQRLVDKKVEIVLEDGFYKLRIIDIKDRPEADKYITILKNNQVTQVWLLTLRAMSKQMLLTQKPDTILRAPQPSDSISYPSFYTDMSIQVGAFRNEAYAKGFRDKIAVMINKKITIVDEDGWHKVRISGFTSAEDLEKYLPTLGLNGIRDMWIVTVKDKPVTEEPPAVKKPVVAAGQVTGMKHESLVRSDTAARIVTPSSAIRTDSLPVQVQPVNAVPGPVQEKSDSTKVLSEKPIVPVTPPEPTISLQVALFNKKNQALKAQKRIKTKLNLPVEIVEQWGYYKVIVTGFYTREETYKFYPELAGLGYPNITLIESK